ncbi:hypothetical protein ROLI_015140 [Roseobacter fucihabitans]|uniref:Uncharacterized protein n=1 Tax=Roseobacter fucihabitans TaxID=1537242 RepID=A0ABZ2BR05_9RHOB|nr:hypothetical protein [Roseobacter litoralis]MBC6965443.1 hypothetical protein [Roseobacter litoralis]
MNIENAISPSMRISFPLRVRMSSGVLIETVAAPNKLKKHEPIKRNLHQGRGAKVRAA